MKKGSKHNVGVVVRRGDAHFRHVQRRNEHLVINDPHDWVYWSWQFARRFPQPSSLDGRPCRHCEADAHTRLQPFHISNQIPTENIMMYTRSAYVESLVRRNKEIESIRHIESIRQSATPQPSCSSAHAVAPVAPSSAPCLLSSPSSTSLATTASNRFTKKEMMSAAQTQSSEFVRRW